MGSVLSFFEDNWEKFANFALNLAIGILIWVCGKYVIRKISAGLERGMKAAKNDPTISEFAANLVGTLLKIMLFIMVLSYVGIDTGPFTALLAGATFAIAYSFQDSLGHVAAGLSLLYQKVIRTGDLVKAADVTGHATKVEVFFTTITASTGRVYICPNANVAFAPIHNVTTNKYVRAELEFEVADSYDLGEIRKFLVDAMYMNSFVEPEPEPDVVVDSIGDESLTLLARAWVSAEHYLEYRHRFLEDVLIRFERSPLSLAEGVADGGGSDDDGSGSGSGSDGEGGDDEDGEGHHHHGHHHAPKEEPPKERAVLAPVQEMVGDKRKVSANFIPD